MHPDAEHALAQEPLLEQAGEVGADTVVRGDGVFGAVVVESAGGHGVYMLRHGGKTGYGVGVLHSDFRPRETVS